MGRLRFADGEVSSGTSESERSEGASGDESEGSDASWNAVTRPQRSSQPVGGQVRILGSVPDEDLTDKRVGFAVTCDGDDVAPPGGRTGGPSEHCSRAVGKVFRVVHGGSGSG